MVHWYLDKTWLFMSLEELTLVKIILMIIIMKPQTRMRATIKNLRYNNIAQPIFQVDPAHELLNGVDSTIRGVCLQLHISEKE